MADIAAEDTQGVAFVAALALAVLVLLAAGFRVFVALSKKSETSEKDNTTDGPQGGAGRQARRRADRMRDGMRRRRGGGAAAGAEAAAEGDDGSGGDGNESDDGEPLNRKDAKKKAKRDMQQAQAAAREAKEKKKSAYEDKIRAKEDEREAAEAARQEEMAAAEAEKQKQQDEEDSKWMNMFTVDEGGTAEDEVATDDQGLLSKFVDFIKERKTVLLEEVAAEFGLRVTDVINRVKGLEEMGRLTGVMDDRGKYIYISMEELEAVADFIKTRGRISISELAIKSNTFIDLESKASSITAQAGGVDFNIDALDEPEEEAATQ